MWTSADGIAWTETNAGTPRSLFSVAWSGSRFVAVGGQGVRVESADGVTWSARDSGTENDLLAVRSAGGKLFALGKAGTVLREGCDPKRASRVSSFR